MEYKKWKKEAKRPVAKAKEAAWKEWYDNLETKEGEETIYKKAKVRARKKKDITQMATIKERKGRVLGCEDETKKRWKEYFEELLSVENERGRLGDVSKVEGPIEEITSEEMKRALQDTKRRKASGPSGVTVEYRKYLGDVGVEWLKNLLNRILVERKIPEDWADSELVTIYKEKRDPMEYSNYRGIKLLEHGLKVLEKILDKRLRQKITIDRMQFGFSPGKGTADAIFMIRQVQEKLLEKNKIV